MRNRHKDAWEIWNVGASNPMGVANALLQAMLEARDDHSLDDDPSVQMILDHLCFLCGLPQPSLSMPPERWDAIYNTVEGEANHAKQTL